MVIEINAENQSLGRLASKIAFILRGKNSPQYQPNKLPETQVLVKNLNKVKWTGSKFNQKIYYHYSGYHSGIKARKISELWAKKPNHVLRQCVYTMLPTNRMRDKIIKNLKFAK